MTSNFSSASLPDISGRPVSALWSAISARRAPIRPSEGGSSVSLLFEQLTTPQVRSPKVERWSWPQGRLGVRLMVGVGGRVVRRVGSGGGSWH